jgi:hypothetical protein
MKRIVAVVAVAIVGLGGATVAWAQTSEDGTERAERRRVLRECLDEARQANPGADKPAVREAVRSCAEARGVKPRELTPEQRERREQAKACLQAARDANPEGDKAAIRQAARSCLEEKGLVRELTPEQQARRAKFRECVQKARADHPDDREAVRQAVKECMNAG